MVSEPAAGGIRGSFIEMYSWTHSQTLLENKSRIKLITWDWDPEGYLSVAEIARLPNSEPFFAKHLTLLSKHGGFRWFQMAFGRWWQVTRSEDPMDHL